MIDWQATAGPVLVLQAWPVQVVKRVEAVPVRRFQATGQVPPLPGVALL